MSKKLTKDEIEILKFDFLLLPASEFFIFQEYHKASKVILICKETKEQYKTDWFGLKNGRVPSIRSAINPHNVRKKKFLNLPASEFFVFHKYINSNHIILLCKQFDEEYKATWKGLKRGEIPTITAAINIFSVRQKQYQSFKCCERFKLIDYKSKENVILKCFQFSEQYKCTWNDLKNNIIPTYKCAVNVNSLINKMFNSYPISENYTIYSFEKMNNVILKCKKYGELYKTSFRIIRRKRFLDVLSALDINSLRQKMFNNFPISNNYRFINYVDSHNVTVENKLTKDLYICSWGSLKIMKKPSLCLAVDLHGICQRKFDNCPLSDDYDFIRYDDSKNVIIRCKEFGEDYKMYWADIMVGHRPTIRCTLNPDSLAKKKLIQRRGNEYDYSKLTYNGNHKNVTIICNVHGEFNQSYDNHLQGAGCPKCGNKNKGYDSWTESSMKKSLNGKKSSLYLLECWDDSEKFYKIGLTNCSLKHRYSTKDLMPYNYKVIYKIQSLNYSLIWETELNLKDLIDYYNLYYKPETYFAGSVTETIHKDFEWELKTIFKTTFQKDFTNETDELVCNSMVKIWK